MSSLVQQVRAAQTDKEHLQQRVTHEQTGHDTRYRQQVVPQAQRLCLAGKRPQQDVGQHGHDISEVARDVSHTVQPQHTEQSVPTVRVVLYGLFLLHFFLVGNNRLPFLFFFFFPLFRLRLR